MQSTPLTCTLTISCRPLHFLQRLSTCNNFFLFFLLHASFLIGNYACTGNWEPNRQLGRLDVVKWTGNQRAAKQVCSLEAGLSLWLHSQRLGILFCVRLIDFASVSYFYIFFYSYLHLLT